MIQDINLTNGKNFKLINIDISGVVIEAMQQKTSHIPKLIWKKMDVTKMSFDDRDFTFAVDKGTMDALLCGDDSEKNVKKMLLEVYRVLKPGGKFIVISYGTPDIRKNHFLGAKMPWELDIETIRK